MNLYILRISIALLDYQKSSKKLQENIKNLEQQIKIAQETVMLDSKIKTNLKKIVKHIRTTSNACTQFDNWEDENEMLKVVNKGRDNFPLPDKQLVAKLEKCIVTAQQKNCSVEGKLNVIIAAIKKFAKEFTKKFKKSNADFNSKSKKLDVLIKIKTDLDAKELKRLQKQQTKNFKKITKLTSAIDNYDNKIAEFKELEYMYQFGKKSFNFMRIEKQRFEIFKKDRIRKIQTKKQILMNSKNDLLNKNKVLALKINKLVPKTEKVEKVTAEKIEENKPFVREANKDNLKSILKNSKSFSPQV